MELNKITLTVATSSGALNIFKGNNIFYTKKIYKIAIQNIKCIFKKY